jgi:hypothetical protein
VSRGHALEGDIEFYKQINEIQTQRIQFLENYVRDLREERDRLLAKVLGKEQVVTDVKDFNPIGGYKSLRQRIAEAEQKAQQEFDNENNEDNRDSVASGNS